MIASPNDYRELSTLRLLGVPAVFDSSTESPEQFTAAVRAVVRYAFEDLDLHRVEAACQPDNMASRRVLEKNGFVEEGYAKHYLQINGRWEHLLESLWMKYADEDELRRDVRYVVYHISGDAALLDTKKDYEKNSFTLHQFWSLEQAEHWVKWAESVLLHAEKGEQEASGALMEGLELYKPKDPIINDLIDTREMEIEEEGEVEGSRAICWACSI